ncbi:hypothetical protein COO60DRAFT_1465043 [Scenedesmus sp. NREL 46B-D3]|nr:hypothetical protein COO60DRAFT_1465043 [Scenedesmus sp. NREL 46B-D3]
MPAASACFQQQINWLCRIMAAAGWHSTDVIYSTHTCLSSKGDMSSLWLVEEAMPQLTSAGQVLVEVRALGLNLADVFCCLGFDATLDSLGGEYFRPSYAALNPCGRHVIFGAGSLTPKPGIRLSSNPAVLLAAPASLLGLLQLLWGWLQRPRLDVISMPGDNKGVVGFNLIWLYDRLDLLAELYDKLDGLNLGPPLVGKVFKFKDMPAALLYLQSGRSVGKVVVTVQHADSAASVAAAMLQQQEAH